MDSSSSHGRSNGIDGTRIDEGLIALYVDVDVGRDVRRDLCDPVGPITVVRSRQNCFTRRKLPTAVLMRSSSVAMRMRVGKVACRTCSTTC